MDCSPPGSSVHGILQARILEWVGMPSSRGSSQTRDWTYVSSLLFWQAGSIPLTPPGKSNVFFWCITNYHKLRGLKSYKLTPHSFPGSGTEVPLSQSHQADIKVLAGVRISSQAWRSFPGSLVAERTRFLLFGELPSEFCHIPSSMFSNTIWKHINRRISLLLKVHLARSDPYRIISLQTNS